MEVQKVLKTESLMLTKFNDLDGSNIFSVNATSCWHVTSEKHTLVVYYGQRTRMKTLLFVVAAAEQERKLEGFSLTAEILNLQTENQKLCSETQKLFHSCLVSSS